MSDKLQDKEKIEKVKTKDEDPNPLCCTSPPSTDPPPPKG